jgi:phosphatidate cytidylyltransferase
VLRQRSFSAVFIVLAALLPALFGHPVFTLALALLAVIAAREFCQAVGTFGVPTYRIFSVVIAALVVIVAGFQWSVVLLGALATTLVLGGLAAGITASDYDLALRSWLYTLAGTAYVAVPLAHGAALRRFEGDLDVAWVANVTEFFGDSAAAGFAWLVLIVAVTWLTDTAAYLFGRSFGRIKLTPRLSPGKTREGAIAGLVAGSITGIVVVAGLGLTIPVYVGALLGLILSVVTQIGDLSESLIKRSLGIKDMGNFIPGHGGILDRIDALLFTLPLGYYLIRIAQEVRWP